jgi:hypothetical protein
LVADPIPVLRRHHLRDALLGSLTLDAYARCVY